MLQDKGIYASECKAWSSDRTFADSSLITMSLKVKMTVFGHREVLYKCKFHHHGPCTVKCANCKKVGHLTRDCWNPTTANHQRTITCYECGNQGHYKSDCPELENRNHGNQAKGTEARGMAYALGGGKTNQDLDNIEDDINA
ncbi:hypothetical protein Tco_1019666 [Tanacetum coccineum]|uniref:CCHC-type domain-containing protein n=1 Tax=Tanacetum coccineum TaxID=301880 RepID=A0ABQ5FY04_9ASTR